MAAAVGDHASRQPAGCHRRYRHAQRILQPIQHAVHHGGSAQHDAAAQAILCAASQRALRRKHIRHGKACALCQSIRSQTHAGCDSAAQESAPMIQHGKGGGGAHVDQHQRRRVLGKRTLRGGDQISAQRLRLIDADGNGGFGRLAHHQHGAGDEGGERLPQRLCDSRHDAGEDRAVEALGEIAALRQRGFDGGGISGVIDEALLSGIGSPMIPEETYARIVNGGV